MHARVLRPSNVRVGQKLQKHRPWSQHMKGRTIQSWSTFQVQLKPRDGFTSLVVLWCVCCLVNLWSPYSFQVFTLERGSCASWHHLDAPWIHCLHMCLQAIYNFPDWIYFCTHTHTSVCSGRRILHLLFLLSFLWFSLVKQTFTADLSPQLDIHRRFLGQNVAQTGNFKTWSLLQSCL